MLKLDEAPLQLPELDESSLVKIFSDVGDAEDLARCSLVCKQWRSLCWKVTRLVFYFDPEEAYSSDPEPPDQDKVREQEHAIATVLKRARTEAPGCLKHLDVSFGCIEPSSHWLAWADSLTTLSLVHRRYSGTPVESALWSYILNSQTLERLELYGVFWSKLFMRGWRSPSLKFCHFNCSVTVELLQHLFAAAPVLETVTVGNFEVVSTKLDVSSASLRTFKLVGNGHHRPRVGKFKLLLRSVPRLTELEMGGFGSGIAVRLSLMQPADSLKLLGLCGACTLDKGLNNVKHLFLRRNWESAEQLGTVLRHTPMINELHLLISQPPVISPSCFLPLLSLKHLHVESGFFRKLEDGLKLERTTVHLTVNNPHDVLEDREYLCIRNILASSQILRLEVHYYLWRLNDLKSKVLHGLFELHLLFPDRVIFRPCHNKRFQFFLDNEV